MPILRFSCPGCCVQHQAGVLWRMARIKWSLRANLLVSLLVQSKEEPCSIRFFPKTKASPMGSGSPIPNDLWILQAASPTGTLAGKLGQQTWSTWSLDTSKTLSNSKAPHSHPLTVAKFTNKGPISQATGYCVVQVALVACRCLCIPR